MITVRFAVLVVAGAVSFFAAGQAFAAETQLSRLECARKAQAAAAKFRALAAELEGEAAYAHSHDGGFSPELTQEFARWYNAERGKAKSNLPELWRTDLTPEEAGRRQAAVERFSREKSARQTARGSAIQEEAESGCPVLRSAR